jgi:AraC-like DNA-binding protein
MTYKRIAPAAGLEKYIECYWIVENDDPTPVKQKIIPDGFTEIIFDYGEPYRIRLKDVWENQTTYLMAGQIKSHFFLENTGKAGVIGIKFKPAALTQWFGINMHAYTDKVVDLLTVDEIPATLSEKLISIAITGDHDKLISGFNELLLDFVEKSKVRDSVINDVVDLIFQKKGMITVQELTRTANLSERQLQRLFGRFIGMSPKFYTRIIRFSYIFELIQENSPRLTDISYDAGYFDQSHFIRNFKAFTGEDPSRYMFGEKNFANFFLKKE